MDHFRLTPSSRVKVTSKSFSQNQELTAELRKLFPTAQVNDQGLEYDPVALIDYLRDADAAIIGLEKMSKEVLQELPRLKIISKYGVGLDNVDLEAARQLGKRVQWKAGVNRRSVSELTLSFLLQLARRSFQLSENLKKGQWTRVVGSQLTGKTVGIIGCGFVGTDLIELLQPFRCEILINDIVDKRDVEKAFGVRSVSLDAILDSSDFVSLHVPLTEMTLKIANDAFFAKMRSSAYLLNTCRGPIVCERALARALSEKRIAGAALDVFHNEPNIDTALLQHPEVIATPHIGGSTHEAVSAMGHAAILNLASYYQS